MRGPRPLAACSGHARGLGVVGTVTQQRGTSNSEAPQKYSTHGSRPLASCSGRSSASSPRNCSACASLSDRSSSSTTGRPGGRSPSRAP
eukprot:149165-Chlamydomonas_euryale.AAC.7